MHLLSLIPENPIFESLIVTSYPIRCHFNALSERYLICVTGIFFNFLQIKLIIRNVDSLKLKITKPQLYSWFNNISHLKQVFS